MFFGAGRGFSDEEYQAYIDNLALEREERRRRVASEQAAVDAATDPQERLALQRRRYKCGDRFLTLADMPVWATRARALAAAASDGGDDDAPDNNDGDDYSRASWMRRPQLQFDVTDKQARYPVDDVINTKVSVVRGDITSLEVDGVVNAANSSLMGGGGVDGAIHSAAGPLLEGACRPLGGAETGETKMTQGFALPAKFVLHTVGPVERGDRQLRSCYRSAIDLAVKNGMRSLAFCCVSTGIYGFPLKRATHIALDECRRFLNSLAAGTYTYEPAITGPHGVTAGDPPTVPPTLAAFDRIVFCVFTAEELQCYETLMPSYFPVAGFPAQAYSASGTGDAHDDFNRDDARPAWGGGGVDEFRSMMPSGGGGGGGGGMRFGGGGGAGGFGGGGMRFGGGGGGGGGGMRLGGGDRGHDFY